MTKYKAVLQYIGTRYAGWQIQKNQNTIQGQFREALHTLTDQPISVIGAGRTDSGVHAMEQVAHFTLSREMALKKLLQGLNGILPWDIRVMRLQAVSLDFHAQKDAIKKRYVYRIYNGPTLSPFLYGYVHHIRYPLNVQAMQEAAQQLCQTCDFTGFAAAATQVKNRTRTVFLSQIQKRGLHVSYRIEANGFLHHMVRNIVGTFLQIGAGKRPSGDIQKILDSKKRQMAGPTAPAQGLYMMKIWY
ncbi:tRNA pseudouridine(38-40) synthase TruA [Acidobacteria bacterium AH-259-D05]|nr:tRNA pseudouridine(38-40) synthase TruA [Acidobacteria bacterium AH-259-D05]